MKGLAVFTLFLVIFGSFAYERMLFQTLAQMRGSLFGRTLLQTINLELGSKGNTYDKVVNLLRKMKEDIEKENTAMEEENEAAKRKCALDLSEIDGSIQELEKRKLSNLGKIKAFEAEMEELAPKIAADEELLPNKKETLRLLEEARAKQRQVYEEEKDKIAKYRKALNTARTKFQNLQLGTQSPPSIMFLEVKEAVSNLESGKYLGFVRMITNLLQNGQIISDQNLVGKVLTLIDQLLASLKSDENKLDSIESDNNKAFLVTQNDLNAEISNISTRLKNNQDRVRELQNNKNALLLENSDIDKNVELKKLEREAKEKACNDREAQYLKAKAIRNEQISVIEQALAIFLDPKFSNDTIDTLKRELGL